MAKPIFVFDFDGVLHLYTSGRQGATTISDPIVPGAIEYLAAVKEHFTVAVFSSRSNEPGGIDAMRTWLYNMAFLDYRRLGKDIDPAYRAAADLIDGIQWPTVKPPAFVTLDDRAVTFTGTWPDLEAMRAFKPWNK